MFLPAVSRLPQTEGNSCGCAWKAELLGSELPSCSPALQLIWLHLVSPPLRREPILLPASRKRPEATRLGSHLLQGRVRGSEIAFGIHLMGNNTF